MRVLLISGAGASDSETSAVLDALSVGPGPFVQLLVTAALDLGQSPMEAYDQIWLLGDTPDSGALARFKDGGGGVFVVNPSTDEDYRDTALRLARRHSQNCMRWRILWAARWEPRLLMDFRHSKFTQASFGEFLRIGEIGREVLKQLAPGPLVDSWKTSMPGIKHLKHSAKEALDEAFTVQIGAMLYAIATEFPVPSLEAKRKAGEVDPIEIMREAMEFARQEIDSVFARRARQYMTAGSLS